eukprot:scaffold4127_cov386-Pinguiococcus_pyrenoidosus.AAC.2
MGKWSGGHFLTKHEAGCASSRTSNVQSVLSTSFALDVILDERIVSEPAAAFNGEVNGEGCSIISNEHIACGQPCPSLDHLDGKGCIGCAGLFGVRVIDHFPAGASRERLVTDGRQAEQSSIFLFFLKLYV